MSNQYQHQHPPTEEELFTLRHSAEQAQKANPDREQILHHLNRMMEDVQNLRTDLQSSQPQTSSLQSLTSAIQTLAAQNAKQMANASHYQAQIQSALEHLTLRLNAATRFLKSRIRYSRNPTNVNVYDTSTSVLDEMYGDQNSIEEINHKLTRLRQTGSVSDYIALFRALASRSGWNDPALLSHFKDGLSHEVRVIPTANPHMLTTLRDTRSSALTAYQNSHSRNRFQRPHQTNGHQPPRRHHIPGSVPSSSSGSGPMEVDAIKFKHITAEEKQRCRDNNLCL
ncbi:hypothetical protein BGZ83_012138 [Gryganskiella cystojenkinii]|nr:hypothetical protein BGZ83_012138 [Gryganskiella cystojenkinii]